MKYQVLRLERAERAQGRYKELGHRCGKGGGSGQVQRAGCWNTSLLSHRKDFRPCLRIERSRGRMLIRAMTCCCCFFLIGSNSNPHRHKKVQLSVTQQKFPTGAGPPRGWD